MPAKAANATSRFSDRVEVYVRYRPNYPAALLECLRTEFGLRPAHVVGDIGSGTGFLTEHFLRNGNQTYAVEPNEPMRAAAERLLAGMAGFHSVAGSAEDTTLPDASVDWIAAGQAFHWFDADRCGVEWRRILRPGGQVLLVWNDRRVDTAFLRDFEQMLLTHSIDYAAVRHQSTQTDGSIEAFFGGRSAYRTFDNAQVVDYDGLRGRVLSASYMPGPDDPRHAAMITALRRVFDRYATDSRVTLTYDTKAYLGRLA